MEPWTCYAGSPMYYWSEDIQSFQEQLEWPPAQENA